MSVKVHVEFGSTSRVISLPENSTFEHLTQSIRRSVSLPEGAIRMTYKDGDGDVLGLADDDDMFDFLQCPSHTIVIVSGLPRSAHSSVSCDVLLPHICFGALALTCLGFPFGVDYCS